MQRPELYLIGQPLDIYTGTFCESRSILLCRHVRYDIVIFMLFFIVSESNHLRRFATFCLQV